MSALPWNMDPRPQCGGWAPGGYSCKCNICGQQFAGDKRAVWCADCAYKRNAEEQSKGAPAPTPPNESAELAAATERIRQYIGGKDLYAVYAGATADDDQRYFEEDIDTVLAALASAQRDAAIVDWLNTDSKRVITIWPYAGSTMLSLGETDRDGKVTPKGQFGPDIRTAIDTAMKAPPQ